MKKILLSITAIVLLVSCNREEFSHESEWILPLIKTRVTAEQVSSLENVKLNTTAEFEDPNEFIFIDDSQPVPAISGQSVGPLLLEDEDDYFSTAQADSAILKVYVENNFPINMKAGSIIRITNTTNTDIVFTGVLERDIAAFSNDSIVVEQYQGTPFIDNDLFLYIDNFSSDGTNGVTQSFAGGSIKISFKIVAIRIVEVNFNANKLYDLSDTIDFSVGDEGQDDAQNINRAKMTLYVENGIPVNFFLQVYFLDGNYNLVDSLLSSTDILSPEVDAAGVVIESTVKEYDLVTEWTKEEFESLSDNAEYAYIRALFTTPSTPSTFKIKHENQIGLQLIADVDAEIKL